MEEKKNKSAWSIAAVFAAIALAVVALAMSWQALTGDRREIAALAMLQLRSAVLVSVPYRKELDLLQHVTSGDPGLARAIDTLAEFQDSGIPSIDGLRNQFAVASESALVVEQSRPELGVLDALASRIAATAIVVGLQTGANPLDSELGPIVGTVNQYLNEGQIAQAISVLEAVPPDLATGLSAWRATAADRLAVEDALAELSAKLMLGPPAAAEK